MDLKLEFLVWTIGMTWYRWGRTESSIIEHPSQSKGHKTSKNYQNLHFQAKILQLAHFEHLWKPEKNFSGVAALGTCWLYPQLLKFKVWRNFMVDTRPPSRKYKFPSLVLFLEEPLKFEPKLQNSNEFFQCCSKFLYSW